MPPSVVAFLFAAGFSTWVYTKISNKTGGNNRDSLVVAGIAFAFGFVALFLILNAIDKVL